MSDSPSTTKSDAVSGAGSSHSVIDTTLLLAIISSTWYAYAVAYFVGYCNWFQIPWALISVSPAQYLDVAAFELPGFLVAALLLVLVWPIMDRMSERRFVASAPVAVVAGVASVAGSLSSVATLSDVLSVVLGIVLPAVVTAVFFLVFYRFVSKPFEDVLLLVSRRRFTVTMFAIFGFAVSAWFGTWWAASRTEFEMVTVNGKYPYVVLQYFGDNIVAAPLDKNHRLVRSCVKIFKTDDSTLSGLENVNLGTLKPDSTADYSQSLSVRGTCN